MSGRMRLVKKFSRTKPIPGGIRQFAALHHAEQCVLLGGIQGGEAAAAHDGGAFLLDRRQAATPSLLHVRHVAFTEAVALVGHQLGVEQGSQGHLGRSPGCGRMRRHNASAASPTPPL